MNDESYLYLKRKLVKLTKIDLDNYKSQQMQRRLGNFIERYALKNIIEYCQLIESNPAELRKLLDFLTINVSEFFRDSHIFKHLETDIIPKLLTYTKYLNIWSAGCSRGQEPYSLAMMMETSFPSVKYRILATDIDQGALLIARSGGPYTHEDVRNVPDSVRSGFLSVNEGKYLVKDELKKRIDFRQQNLLGDPFDHNFDLIVCRNVTIYFTEQAKRELNNKFYSALKPNGVLFIGGTEVMLDAPQLGFSGAGVCFYQKKEPSKTSIEISGQKIAVSR
ncbi:MAG: protein-glutamate O-methyltransferase CheR [Dehalococcoidales bacterium]|nr:protein-glutamate O-methyltransferase CheR [Dehalococcoidales bacterium]